MRVVSFAGAFLIGFLVTAAAFHAFGYRVIDLPPLPMTASDARRATQASPQQAQWHAYKANERHRGAAGW